MSRWFRCHIPGCPLKGVRQFLSPPQTGREGWERHYTAQHGGLS